MQKIEKSFNVSFYNYEKEVLGNIELPSKVYIHDVTLRDGEQQAGIVFKKEEKVEIAQALMEAGVDRIEAGMPSVYEKDFEAVKEIAKIKTGSSIYAFARCMRNDVDLALKCDVDGVVMEIPSSDHLIQKAYGWTVEKAVNLSIDATRYAHEHGLKVTFFTIDATRAPFESFWKIVEGVIKEGHMDSLTLADTFGVLNPHASYYFIKRIREKVNKPIEIHAHNDFGLAVANSIFAVLGGASTVHVSVTGIGERSGNAALEEVVMALKCLYGIETSIKTEKLRKLASIVRKYSGINFTPQKPIVGDALFTVESGILVGWWKRLEELNEPLEMFPYLPQMVGHDPVKIILGKKSGLDSIIYKSEKLGLNISENKRLRLLKKVKALSYLRKGPLSDEEFKIIAEEE